MVKKNRKRSGIFEENNFKKIILIMTIVFLVVNVFTNITIIRITGGVGVTGTAAICINTRPTIDATADQSIRHDLPFAIDINASDVESHNFNFSDNSSLFVINNESGLISFTPTLEDFGNHTISITVSETNSSCNVQQSATFNIEIFNLNPTLNATILNQTWEQNTQQSGLDLDDYFSDPEGDTLNYSSINGGSMTITIDNNSVVTFDPDTNFAGETWAIFIANDTRGIKRSNNVTLNVTADTDAPTITINAPNQTQNANKLSTALNVSISEIGTITYSLDGQSNVTICSLCVIGSTEINFTLFGNHSVIVYAEDSVNNVNSSTLNFNLTLDSDNDGIADDTDTDDDNDGIVDSNDTVVGNVTNVNTNIIGLNLTINNSINLSQQFNGTLHFNFSNSTHPLLEFDYDFSENKTLLLSNISITKQAIGATKGSLIVKNVFMTSNKKKTIYIEDLDDSRGSVCVRDLEMDSINEISANCNETNETLIACSSDGTTSGDYTCTDIGSLYRISGVTHSGAIEFTDAETEETPASTPAAAAASSGGGGGGGGGGSIVSKCSFKTSCSAWGPAGCNGDGTQTRTCITVKDDCSIDESISTRDCICVPEWSCSIWEPQQCPSNGIQTRTCRDLNKCGRELTLPLENTCEPGPIPPTSITSTAKKALAGQAFLSDLKNLDAGSILIFVLFAIANIVIFLALVLWKKKKHLPSATKLPLGVVRSQRVFRGGTTQQPSERRPSASRLFGGYSKEVDDESLSYIERLKRRLKRY